MTVLGFARKLLISVEKGMIMRYLIYLLLFASNTLFAGTIQKWVDEDGNIFYGDTPPISTKTESVKVIGAPSNPGKALPRLSNTESSTSSTGDTEAAAQEGNQELAKEACTRAKSDLAVIGNSTRIRLKAADGKETFMTEEQISERKQRAESDVSQFCQ